MTNENKILRYSLFINLLFLNAEIRLRKLTLTKVKANCPLFKQRKLSIDEKVRNIKSLIDTQLSFKTLANMEDLESAIMSAASNNDQRVANPHMMCKNT